MSYRSYEPGVTRSQPATPRRGVTSFTTVGGSAAIPLQPHRRDQMATDSLPVEHLFTMRPDADLARATVIKRGPHGTRVSAGVTGGTFEGPRLRGRIVPPGGDWPTSRPAC